ncbi:HAD family hydrolase [Streptomyces sp. GZWMJZ-114]|uniref:HAD family hydrolase n=1 Tax=Streptomyces sp. GZWMJZ-114 TaxID=2494734 RepID=UPI0010108CB0|nr:HAD family hydrolase [Streptomyces sp. GZWMJZ-114]
MSESTATRLPATWGGRAIEAITLDVGGVLLLPQLKVIRDIFRPLGFMLADTVIDSAHYHAVAAVDAAAEHDWQTYLTHYVAACGIKGRAAAYATERLDEVLAPDVWLRSVAGAKQALEDLSRNYRISLISNSTGVIASLLARDEVRMCQVGPGPGVPVTAIYDSHHVGVDKPDPRIFRLALETMGSSVESTLHVGDTIHADIRGAQATGMPSAHIDPLSLCGSCGATLHLRGLSELSTLLVTRTA